MNLADETPPTSALDDPQAGPGPEGSLKQASARAKTSAGYVLGGHVGGEVLRLVSNMILVRLFPPQFFGLMALVNVVMRGLKLFSDVGIGPSVVQSPHGEDPDFINSAWTIQVARGIGLFVVAAAISQPVAALYREPTLVWLLPAAATSALFAGFNSTKIFTGNRNLLLGRIVTLEVGGRVLGLIVTMVWALLHPTIWALVMGGAVGTAVSTAFSHTWLPGPRNRLHWDRTHVRNLLRFGRWIFLSTLLTFASLEIDTLMFGKYLSMADLGAYSVALALSRIPSTALSAITGQVVFPLYSHAFRDGSSNSQVFLSTRRAILSGAGWILGGVIGGSGVIIGLLYPKTYVDAGWILRILAVGVWIAVLTSTNSSALLAQGQARWMAIGWGTKVTTEAVAIVAGYMLGGMPLAVGGVALSEVANYVVISHAAYRHGFRGRLQDLGFSCLVAASALLGWFAARVGASYGGHPVVLAALVFVVCTSLWAPLLLPLIKARRLG